MKKSQKIAALGLVAALSLGTVSAAVADTKGPGKGSIGAMGASKGGINQTQLATILAGLKTAGKLTDANIADINAAITVAIAAKSADGDMEIADGDRDARNAVILSTLGITADVLKAARKDGKSLAQIDPTKTAALIIALVAFETKNIDAAVTAGKLTAVQATTLKANLSAMVTAMVNSTKGPNGNKAGKGPKDGKGPKGGNHSPAASPSASPSSHA